MAMRNGFMWVLPALVLAAATMIGGAGSAGASSAVFPRASAVAAPPRAPSKR